MTSAVHRSISTPDHNPLYIEESKFSNRLQWVALKLQQPLYTCSKTTLRTYASDRYSKRHFKVYVYGVMALSAIGMILTVPLALVGALLYWISDKVSQKSFTYLKGTGKELPASADPLKIMTLNTCMLPGGLPFVLGGVPPAK